MKFVKRYQFNLKTKSMTVAIITKEDFHEFKMEILEEIKKVTI